MIKLQTDSPRNRRNTTVAQKSSQKLAGTDVKDKTRRQTTAGINLVSNKLKGSLLDKFGTALALDGYKKLSRHTDKMFGIYAGVVDHDPNQKVKPEKIKFVKAGIKKYLMRRYTARGADIIIQYLRFPGTGTFSDFCTIIE